MEWTIERSRRIQRKRRLSISQIAQMGDRGTQTHTQVLVMKHSVEGVDIRTIYRRGHICVTLFALLFFGSEILSPGDLRAKSIHTWPDNPLKTFIIVLIIKAIHADRLTLNSAKKRFRNANKTWTNGSKVTYPSLVQWHYWQWVVGYSGLIWSTRRLVDDRRELRRFHWS